MLKPSPRPAIRPKPRERAQETLRAFVRTLEKLEGARRPKKAAAR